MTLDKPVTLDESYRRCAEITRRAGTSYYAATWLLPAIKRPHIHAIYAFCRYADDIVDDTAAANAAERAEALGDFATRFWADLDAGSSRDPILHAVVHTVRAFRIDPGCFERFLRSMTMDLTVASYADFDALLGYMDGSAAVVGEMMLPILEPTSPEALPHARDLGIAFQLTNFWRDVAEDLDRGRVYIPADDLERFDAREALAERRVDARWVALLRFEIARTRRYYVSGREGLASLPPASARCVGAAIDLYGGILDRIEAAGYDVWAGRVRVPRWRKAAVAAGALKPVRRYGS